MGQKYWFIFLSHLFSATKQNKIGEKTKQNKNPKFGAPSITENFNQTTTIYREKTERNRERVPSGEELEKLSESEGKEGREEREVVGDD